MDSSNPSLAQKIARRFQAEHLGDPKVLVEEFAGILKKFELSETTLAKAKTVLQDPAFIGQSRAGDPDLRAAVSISVAAIGIVKRGHGLISGPGHKLFLSILQTYTLPPALRKKIEIASRVYMKETRPRFKNKYGNGLYVEYIVAYDKYVSMLADHLDFAREAIKIGKEHAEEAPEGGAATKFKVGPFTVVNTGGFSDKQMAEVKEVVSKAVTLLQASGLSQVCYGEIQVTNTLWKANVLAFYLVGKDEMFIRANVKANHDTVRTVLHELGHRFENKFLKGGDKVVNQLYRLLNGQELARKHRLDESMVPKVGEELVSKGKTYKVTKAVPIGGNEYKIYLQREDEPELRASISLEGWLASKGISRDVDADPNYIGFVSNYAKSGGPGENFAEMFAFYCMNKLPALQSAPFESIVFGDGKLNIAASVMARSAGRIKLASTAKPIRDMLEGPAHPDEAKTLHTVAADQSAPDTMVTAVEARFTARLPGGDDEPHPLEATRVENPYPGETALALSRMLREGSVPADKVKQARAFVRQYEKWAGEAVYDAFFHENNCPTEQQEADEYTVSSASSGRFRRADHFHSGKPDYQWGQHHKPKKASESE